MQLIDSSLETIVNYTCTNICRHHLSMDTAIGQVLSLLIRLGGQLAIDGDVHQCIGNH